MDEVAARRAKRSTDAAGRPEVSTPGPAERLEPAAGGAGAEPPSPAPGPGLGNAATARVLGGDPGHPLPSAVRADLAALLGADLSAVRVHVDAAAPRSVGALAFTVGRHVTVDPEQYRPDTAAGRALLAHEAAHVVQQAAVPPAGRVASPAAQAASGTASFAGTDTDMAAERAADDVAAAALRGRAGRPGLRGPRPRGVTRALRGALSLQRCSSGTSEEIAKGRELLKVTDPVQLEAALETATDDQLRRAAEAVPAGSVQADALAWETALRARNFTALSALVGRTDRRFRTAYAVRLLRAITAGRTSIRIAGGDPAFGSWVEGQLGRLLSTPSGFQLVVQLLATGKPVRLQPAAAGAGSTTDPLDRQAASLQQEPSGAYRRGAGSGSTVSFDVARSANEVELGRQGGRLTLIDADPTSSVGHELIHALHNATGENLSPLVSPAVLRGVFGGVGLVRDPDTGEPMNPEELRTITGRTSFGQVTGASTPDRPVSYPVGAGVTENVLRTELGEPVPRVSHVGAVKTRRIPRRGAADLDAVVARYTLGTAPLPPRAAAAVRAALVALHIDLYLRATSGPDLVVADPSYVLVYVRFVQGDAALAESLGPLTVR